MSFLFDSKTIYVNFNDQLSFLFYLLLYSLRIIAILEHFSFSFLIITMNWRKEHRNHLLCQNVYSTKWNGLNLYFPLGWKKLAITHKRYYVIGVRYLKSIISARNWNLLVTNQMRKIPSTLDLFFRRDVLMPRCRI